MSQTELNPRPRPEVGASHDRKGWWPAPRWPTYTKGETVFRHDLNRRIERIQTAIVWRLPRWLIKWAVVRGAVQTRDNYPGDVIASDIIKRFSA